MIRKFDHHPSGSEITSSIKASNFWRSMTIARDGKIEAWNLHSIWIYREKCSPFILLINISSRYANWRIQRYGYIYIGFLREKRKILSKDMCLKELSGVRFIDKYFCQVEKNNGGNAFDKMVKRISNKFPSFRQIQLFYFSLF